MVKKVALKPKVIYNKYIHIVPSYLNVLIIYQEEGDFHLLFFWKIFREKWKNPKLFKLEIFYRLFKSISFKNYSHINCYKINHLYL